MMKRLSKTFILAISSVIIQGCVFQNDGFEDIERKMFEFVNNDTSNIAPLPVIEEYERFSYNAGDDRNVFERLYFEDQEVVTDSEQADLPGPDRFRVKEQLEEYDIEEIKYIGMMSKGNDVIAIMKDPKGISHIVKKGNYLGVNNGEIVDINKLYVVVNELLNNGNRWVNGTKKIHLYSNIQSRSEQ